MTTRLTYDKILGLLREDKSTIGPQGKPLIVLENGNYGNWDEDLQEYVDSGIEAAAIVDINNGEVTFAESETKANINSGESIPNLFGKIKKWFNSFGALAWKSSVDYALEVSNKPDIPDQLVDLEDDSTHRTVSDIEKSTWNGKSDFSGSYNDLSNKPSIPSTFDQLADGTTNKAFTLTEKTKLSGIAMGATANDTDANLKDRANHTGVQEMETISGLSSALALKADLESPALTGNPTAPTQDSGDNSTKLATTAFVKAIIQEIINNSPAALDTLDELASALGDDPNFATTISILIGEKLAKASNLSDLTDVATARTNLGLGTLALLSSLALSDLSQDSTHRTVSDTEKSTWNGKPELGETSSTAYKGDRGKTAYDHSQASGNPHGTTKEDLGLGAVENTALSTWAGSSNLKTVGFAYGGYATKTAVSGDITISFADTDPICLFSFLEAGAYNVVIDLTNAMYGKKITWLVVGGTSLSFPVGEGMPCVVTTGSITHEGNSIINLECMYMDVPEEYTGPIILITIKSV